MNARRTAAVAAFAASVLLAAACSSASTGPSPAAKASAASAAASQSAAAAAIASEIASEAAASPTPAAPTKVEFVVSGSAPDGIDITYGPSGSNFAGPSTLDGTATMSVPFDSSASYYSLNAQLQGDGDIICKIVVTGPGDAPLTASHGAASGGYNICTAQATSDDGGLTWQDEN
jgi:hypothetical protein